MCRRLIASEVTGSHQPTTCPDRYREEADYRTGVREMEIRARLGCAMIHARMDWVLVLFGWECWSWQGCRCMRYMPDACVAQRQCFPEQKLPDDAGHPDLRSTGDMEETTTSPGAFSPQSLQSPHTPSLFVAAAGIFPLFMPPFTVQHVFCSLFSPSPPTLISNPPDTIICS